ncbi:MAG: hypothetical protein CSYNP_03662 [Syntrophus sp. SKADARSKE-3]|nr:hypothetical protein [Syntrophus sp. SKADARSKE-3]
MEEKVDEVRAMDGVFVHGEKMGGAVAVGGAEPGDGSGDDPAYRLRQIVLQVVSCAEGKGKAMIGCFPQIINVPEKVFSFPGVAFQALCQVFSS